jgi:hypothetical protein
VTLARAPRLTDDAERTLAAMQTKHWEIVKLGKRRKKPIGEHWEITTNPDAVTQWLADGFNIGNLGHQRTGLGVLDPDRLDLWADMIDTLGQPCLPWVLTGSGKLHYYVRWEPDLPAKLTWQGAVLGEIQRGPGQQQVVLPPSIHPGTGEPYRWITDELPWLCEPIDPVADPLPSLPGGWLGYLRHHGR